MKNDSAIHLNNETIKKSQDTFGKENEGGVALSIIKIDYKPARWLTQ